MQIIMIVSTMNYFIQKIKSAINIINISFIFLASYY